MKKKSLFLFLIFLSMMSACNHQEKHYAENISALVIEPMYTSLSIQLAQLAQSSEDFCQDNTLAADELSQIQQLWYEAASAWQKAQVLRFGPIEENNRRWHFQFWPDRHNNTGKKMKRLLTSSEPVSLQRLESAGVVVQGFSALEYLLFDPANPVELFATEGHDAKQRCLFLVNASEALSQTASSIQLEWLANGNYRLIFDKPGTENSLYPDDLSSIKVIIESIVTSLEIMKGDKLAKPLGLTSEKGQVNKYLSEAWRSRLSESFMQSNLEGINELLNASNAGVLSQLDDNHIDLIQTIVRQMKEAKQALHKLDVSLVEALETEEGQQKAINAMNAVNNLLKTCKHDLPAAFNITLGFNGNDGD